MSNEQNDLKVVATSGNEAALLAMRDPVSGLPNVELFADRLMMAISLAKRNDWLLAVMLINLDEFRRSIAVHGQNVGDSALLAVVTRLASRTRDGDTLCRLADGELLYLLVNPGSRENTRRVTQRVRDRLIQPLVIDTQELVVAPRIGIAVYPDDGIDVTTLVEHARTAMRKASSRDLSYMFFEADEEIDVESGGTVPSIEGPGT